MIRGLETWFSKEAPAALQRTQIWFQQRHGHSQYSVTPTPGDIMPTSGLPQQCMHMVYRHIQIKTLTDIK